MSQRLGSAGTVDCTPTCSCFMQLGCHFHPHSVGYKKATRAKRKTCKVTDIVVAIFGKYNLPCILFSLLSFQDSNYTYFNIVPQSLRLFLFFNLFFRVDNSYCSIFKFTDPFFSHLQSALSKSNKYFISDTVLLSSRFYIWFFLYFPFLCSHSPFVTKFALKSLSDIYYYQVYLLLPSLL